MNDREARSPSFTGGIWSTFIGGVVGAIAVTIVGLFTPVFEWMVDKYGNGITRAVLHRLETVSYAGVPTPPG
jgi:hypothetical protein